MSSLKYHNKISSLGMGCVTFGREIDRSSSIRLLDYAYECGIDFFDTAVSYGDGVSESILGDWLQFRPAAISSFTIATKIPAPFEAKKIMLSAEESLRRLRVDAIDILYLHSWHDTVGNENVLAALDELVNVGKVRNLGASNFTHAQLARAVQMQEERGFTRFRFVQNNNNIAVSELGADLRSFCFINNIKIITYSPLGAGFLTGKYLNGIKEGTRFHVAPGHKEDYFNENAFRRLATLKDAAFKTGLPVERIALAWALHHPGVSRVLIGAREYSHIAQAISALDFTGSSVFAELGFNWY